LELRPSYDVVVVGSGASGLTAALAAASLKASVVILEKGAKFGGSSSLSGGQLWIPNNSHQKKAGIEDSKSKATKYLTRLARGRVSGELIDSFVAHAPTALDFVVSATPMRPVLRDNESDYHPEWKGGLRRGRTLDPGLFDGRLLGDEHGAILHNPQYHLSGGLHVTSLEFEMLMRGEKVPALKRRKQSTLALGEALVGSLRKGLIDRGVPLYLRHRASSLIVEDGRVSGVKVETEGGMRTVTAKRGVILAAGGFEWNFPMKERFLSSPSENSAGCQTNTGDGIVMGTQAGAGAALMDEAWWFTLILKPKEERGWLVTSERTLPGSMMVNGRGERFVNEAMNYLDVTRAMLHYNEEDYSLENLPAFLIFDSAYLQKYPVAGQDAVAASKWLEKGKTVSELAKKLGIDPTALNRTVEGFNKNARNGKDPRFHRGESFYDRHWGDPSTPNPTLASLEKAPFYGTRILAGDIGTKGGITTDQVGRALDLGGSVIEGLYAVGNNAASVMGPGYAGSGATLGPCITFGYLAGLNCASN